MEARDGLCEDADRSGLTFPFFEYCHYDYDSSIDEEADFTGGVDICGDWGSLGTAVIGALCCSRCSSTAGEENRPLLLARRTDGCFTASRRSTASFLF